MTEISISRFKATCLAVIQQVKQTGEPVRITKFGHVMAELIPPREARPFVGAFAGHGRILGDIVEPASSESDWEALQSQPPKKLRASAGPGRGR